MIDMSKYEGHSKGPWKHMYQAWGGVDYIMSPHEGCVAKIDNGDKSSVENRADALLVADAPLLLEEVKRLRDHIRRMRHWAEPKMHEVHRDAWRKLHEEIYEGGDN